MASSCAYARLFPCTELPRQFLLAADLDLELVVHGIIIGRALPSGPRPTAWLEEPAHTALARITAGGTVLLVNTIFVSPIVQQQALAPVPAKLPPLSFSVSANPPPRNRVLDEFAVSTSSSTFRSVVATFPYDIA